MRSSTDSSTPSCSSDSAFDVEFALCAKTHLGYILHVCDHLIVSLSLFGQLQDAQKGCQQYRLLSKPFSNLGHVDIGLSFLLAEGKATRQYSTLCSGLQCRVLAGRPFRLDGTSIVYAVQTSHAGPYPGPDARRVQHLMTPSLFDVHLCL